jgi:hypothetical protein
MEGQLVSQPLTLATDYALGLTALAGAALLLRKRRGPGSLPARLWAAGFASVGAAAFLGGTWHGFSPRLSSTASAVLWKATLAGTGLAAFFLLAGVAFGSLGRRAAAWVTAAAAAKLVVFLRWAAFHDEYDGVVIDTAAAMGAILLVQLVAWARRRAASAPWIAAGILLSLAAAAVEALGLSPGGPVSHDDVYHSIEIGALVLLYRGGLLLGDLRPA